MGIVEFLGILCSLCRCRSFDRENVLAMTVQRQLVGVSIKWFECTVEVVVWALVVCNLGLLLGHACTTG